MLGDNPVRRCYSVSPIGRGGGAIVGNNGKSSVHLAAAPADSSPTRTFFVQLKGDPGFAKLVTTAADVGDLLEEVASKLRLTQRVSSLTFQLATEDGTLFTAKDATGKEQPVTLNSMDTVDEALEKAAKAAGRTIKPGDKLRIIVSVSAPSAPATGALSGYAALPNIRAFDNVLAPLSFTREGGSQVNVSELVKTLTDAKQPSDRRLEAMAALIGRVPPATKVGLSKIPLPFFNTGSHAHLLSVLTQHAALLHAGWFDGKNGVPCRLLTGPRGAGKSVMLRAFASVCGDAYPSVIPLFVTGDRYGFSGNSFASCDLFQLMVAVAVEHGVAVETTTMCGLEAGLLAANKKMLIILDEVDQLYRVPASLTPQRRNVQSTLGVLAALGDHTGGLFGTLLCGSAAATSRLIAADERMASRYELIRDGGPPDLNSTKFSRLPIWASDCTDIRQTEQMLFPGKQGLSDKEKKLCSTLCFVAGTVPRTIGLALTNLDAGLMSLAPQGGLMRRLFTPPDTLSEDAKRKYWQLMQELRDENAIMLHPTGASSGTLDLSFAEGGLWSTLLQPVRKAGNLPHEQQLLLDDLSDANLIAQRDTPQHGPSIWPMSVAQMLLLTEERSAGEGLFLQAWEKELQNSANILSLLKPWQNLCSSDLDTL